MLPNDWKRVQLHEVAEVRTGLAKGKTNLKDPVQMPYLRVANVQDGHLSLENIKTISVERSQVERYSLRAGDVLMTEGGDFDKLGRGDVWQGQIPVCLHQNHVFAVRPNPKILNSRFLAALASSQHGRNYFLRCAKRSTNLASINASQLKQFPVLLPPLAEQEKIACVLDTWDKAIQAGEHLVSAATKELRELAKRLLSEESRLGIDTKPWTTRVLRDICEFYKGNTLSKDDISSDAATPCILYGELFTTYGELIESVYSRTASAGGFTARRGDVLLPTATTTVAADLAKASALLADGAAIGGDTLIVRPNQEELAPEFLAFLLTHVKKRDIARRAQGATIVHLCSADIESLEIRIPHWSVQQRIVEIIKTSQQQVEVLRRNVELMRKVKVTLVRDLLSGKRRFGQPRASQKAAA